MKLGIYKLHEELKLPVLATEGSACFDLAACLLQANIAGHNTYNMKEKISVRDKRVVIHADQRVLIPTGFVFDIPEGYSLRIHPRSSLAWKKGLTLANCEAVIDSDYVDETFIMIQNISDTSVYIEHGERIAQAELVETVSVLINERLSKPEQKTNRDGGFGSTGEK